MGNFLDYLKREGGDHSGAMVALLGALRRRGIHVRPTSVRKIIRLNCGADSETARLLLDKSAHYEHANEYVASLRDTGIEISCDPHMQRIPFVFGRNVDHGRTLPSFRSRYSDRRGVGVASKEEVRAYIDFLKDGGIHLEQDELHVALSEEHRMLLGNLEFSTFLAMEHGIVVPRCKPGWSDLHSKYSRFRFAGEWYDDSSRTIEHKLIEGRAKISDGMCEPCFASYTAQFTKN